MIPGVTAKVVRVIPFRSAEVKGQQRLMSLKMMMTYLLAGEAELLCLSLSSMAAKPGFSSLISNFSCPPLCAMSCCMEVGGRPGIPG